MRWLFSVFGPTFSELDWPPWEGTPRIPGVLLQLSRIIPRAQLPIASFLFSCRAITIDWYLFKTPTTFSLMIRSRRSTRKQRKQTRNLVNFKETSKMHDIQSWILVCFSVTKKNNEITEDSVISRKNYLLIKIWLYTHMWKNLTYWYFS